MTDRRRAPHVEWVKVVALVLVGVLVAGGCSASADDESSEGNGGGSASTGDHPEGWAPAGADTPGVDDDTIYLGFWTTNPNEGVATASDVGGDGGGSESADANGFSKSAQTLMDYINENGGMAGRDVEMVMHQIPAGDLVSSMQVADQAYQEACATWTEDHEVFMIAAIGVPSALSCAKNAGALVYSDLPSGGGITLDEGNLEEYNDYWFSASFPQAERKGRNVVDGLFNAGFFDSEEEPRVAIMTQDDRTGRASATGGMIPALEEHGITPVKEIRFPEPLTSPWETYVLQLQEAHVTHVLFSGGPGAFFPWQLMQKAAVSQDFYPQWGISSDLDMAQGAYFGAPEEQMVNTWGIGWTPLWDIQAGNGADFVYPYSGSANAKICTDLGVESGLGLGLTLYCDSLLFLKFVLDQADEVSVRGVNDVVDHLGDSYASVQSLNGSTNFVDGRHDGAAEYQVVRFDAEHCANGAYCWMYVGDPQPFK